MSTLLELAKSYHRVDQEPDHCSLHDCGTFFEVVGFQALFHDFARWHVLELEQESPEHGLHCTQFCPISKKIARKNLSNFARFQKYCLHMYPHQIAFDVFAYTGLLSSLKII